MEALQQQYSLYVRDIGHKTRVMHYILSYNITVTGHITQQLQDIAIGNNGWYHTIHLNCDLHYTADLYLDWSLNKVFKREEHYQYDNHVVIKLLGQRQLLQLKRLIKTCRWSSRETTG